MNSREAQIEGLGASKTGFRILAYISAGFAVVGVVLPLLPTTPFIILAACFASKGSPAFAAWLEQHQSFGRAIEQWRQRRAIPIKAKLLACSMMMASWSMLLLLGSPALVLIISGLFLLAVGAYLLTRPTC